MLQTFIKTRLYQRATKPFLPNILGTLQNPTQNLTFSQLAFNSNNQRQYEQSTTKHGSHFGQILATALLFTAFYSQSNDQSNSKKNECLFGFFEEDTKTLKRNRLKDRIKGVQFPAHYPCQDKLQFYQVDTKTKGGFKFEAIYAAVFDGNVGDQLATYCREQLHIYLEEEIQALECAEIQENDIKDALLKAFDRIEKQWKEDSEAAFKVGFPQAAYTSTTALVALIHNDTLFVANAGDSKAVLIRDITKTTNNHGQEKQENSDEMQQKELKHSYAHKNVSTTFNCNKTREQERIRKEHPNERDAVFCRKDQSGFQNCFVKGCLQPTRSFGDFRLKDHDFNFHNFVQDQGYRLPLPIFSGPYISHVPEIRTFTLDNEDKFLVLASDGLYDFIRRRDIARALPHLISLERKKLTKKDEPKSDSDLLTKEVIAKGILNVCVEKAARKEDLTVDFFRNLPPGKNKRMLIDDVTILVVDLEHQKKNGSI